MKRETISTYEEAAAYIMEIPRFTSKNTMDDTRAFLQKLGNPDRSSKIIHVAGTNGKGSVCAYLCSVLKAAGYKCGLFTSPHLVDIRERFVIDGQMVEKEAFLEAFLTVYNKLPWEDLAQDRGYHPTFFEYLFFIAMILFADAGLDYCVLETGLGGRLDATNAVEKKEISVITHMGLDHTEYLGETIEEIAAEKAGIMHEGAPAVYWETGESVSKVLAECAKKNHITAFPVSKSDYGFSKINHKTIAFSYRSLYYDSVRLSLHTIAAYQMENATLALRALEVLLGKEGLSAELMQQGIETAFWAGRMEEVYPEVYVDGAHNPDGIRAFLETVAGDGQDGHRHLILGVVKDKAYLDMAKEIAASGLFTDVSVVQLRGARALDAKRLAGIVKECTGKPVTVYPDAGAAYSTACRESGSMRVYIAGSLYLVGEIKECV